MKTKLAFLLLCYSAVLAQSSTREYIADTLDLVAWRKAHAATPAAADTAGGGFPRSAVAALAQQGVVRVACVGNSITYGSGLQDRHADSYPAVLGRMLGEGYEVQNFGLGGRTMLRKGDRPYMLEQRFRDALRFAPDVVVLKLGTNDSKTINRIHAHELVADAEALADSFLLLPSRPQVLLCYPAKAYGDGLGTICDSVIVADIIPRVREAAQRKGLRVIDLHTATDGMPQNFPDNVHPNEEGAIAIAEAVYEAITGRAKKYCACE